ncbi:chromosomal replication initiator protein [Roseimicrobium gellanilyticum]|uniref:Chromosomal replication initiator protein DnaA n=1 Tax=Roseimicrobium gellanilyticum TaxID=748857 RepID=A0A366HMZ2_9BACT|nr:chromosomal replication initiator protein DnaA [Roseimicrobium gellanilyticum]RBP44527.1 chromosomal replication initiator protein [Roseimicrobium gellanilyticum]
MSTSRRDSDPEEEDELLPLKFPGVPEPGPEVKAWKKAAVDLSGKIGALSFDRWFSKVSIERLDPAPVVLRVPNLMHQYWIEEHFMQQLSSSIAEVAGGHCEIEFMVVPETPVESRPQLREAARSMDRRREAPAVIEAGADEPLFRDEARFARSLSDAGLNHRFSFDSFVVGPNCSYSFAAARAVAEKPGKTYNPLFLHGSVGLGKTHLMQAIGQEILRNKPRKVVRYVTSEAFTNEYIEAVRLHKVNAFRQKYRKVDVLMIDDIQFFAGKGGTQEEVFHTFNDLFNSFKQIILTSDRAPSEIKNLEERLVSRFEWGMTTMIESPDVETRTAILRQKIRDWSVPVEDWVLTHLADNIRTNVRRLEGALMRVAGHLSLSSSPGDRSKPTETALTKETLNSLLADILEEPATGMITIDIIQKVVAEHYDIRLADMNSKRRPANIALPRQIAMYLARQLTKSPFKEIGDAFGGKDHGTIIHACKTITQRIAESEEFRQQVAAVTDLIRKAV